MRVKLPVLAIVFLAPAAALAQDVKPVQSKPVQPYQAKTIEPYHARVVQPDTAATRRDTSRGIGRRSK